MIYSPLEQFNILSIYDFSIVNISNFEIITTQILLFVWYIFYIFPLSIIQNISCFLQTSLGILWVWEIFNMFITLYQTFINILASDFYFISGLIYQFLISTNIIQILLLPETIYNLFFNTWKHLWFMYYTDLNILYTSHIPLLNFNLELPVSSAFLDTNISLISGSFGVFLSNIYFFFQELQISICSTIYKYTVSILFNLTTKDFSYLIFSLNNSTIWLLLGFLFIIFLFSTILKSITLFPKNNWQTLLETMYTIVLDIVNENAGPKGIKHFPLIFTTFLIILICNILGMIPYSFTVTSHLIITFSIALATFIGINILGILKNRYHFLSLFFPPGAPLALAPLLVMIELVSYVFRVLSLSIRLFANLMSGHTLLKILSTFAWLSVSFWGIFLIPIGIIFLITGLEIAIACLQAYIFSVLLCIYINDAFNLH